MSTFDQDELDPDTVHALRALGWSLPLSEAEVARAEAAFAGHPPTVPEAIDDPRMLRDPIARRGPSLLPPSSGAADTAEQLGRAAREGEAIPEDVERKMRDDRDQAEGKRPS